MTEDIKIHRLALHILDNQTGIPIFSETEHPDDADIDEFLESHIEKVFRDVFIKKAILEQDNEVREQCEKLNENNEEFLNISKSLAEKLYMILEKHVSIPACDLFCVMFRRDERDFLGLFILNYKTTYIHNVEDIENKTTNKVVKQITTLPSTSQSIDEFVIVDLSDYSVLLKEKKYEIDGIKDFYLSRLFLKAETILSDKEKMDIVNKTSKKIVKDYYDGDVQKMAEVKTAIAESIEENDTIDIEHIKKSTFGDNLELQDIYSEELEIKGLTEKSFKVNENVVKKIPKMQKLVTEDGIEIKIPIAYLNSSEKVEFINNANGTISIMLKDIRDIQDK